MAAIVEATGPRGSVLGAVVTVLVYGVLPIAVLRYVSGGGRRRRAALVVTAAAAAQAQAAATNGPRAPDALAHAKPPEISDGVDPGSGGLAAGEAVAAVRKEA